MEFVRNLPYDVGFVAKMKEGACNGGGVMVTYGGRMCGEMLTVDSTLKSFVGYVSGPTVMDPGEMAYFAHNLGPGATYTGTLVLGEGGIGPDGATLIMPDDAEGTYTASWTGGPCGATASITVTPLIAIACEGRPNAMGCQYPYIGSGDPAGKKLCPSARIGNYANSCICVPTSGAYGYGGVCWGPGAYMYEVMPRSSSGLSCDVVAYTLVDGYRIHYTVVPC